MRVYTEKGYTDCEFEDFASVEPKLRQVREDFRAKKIDKDKVFELVRPLFGMERVNREWRGVVGDLHSTPAIKAWEAWIDADPKRTKLFYSPETVSGTITQEKQDGLS